MKLEQFEQQINSLWEQIREDTTDSAFNKMANNAGRRMARQKLLRKASGPLKKAATSVANVAKAHPLATSAAALVGVRMGTRAAIAHRNRNRKAAAARKGQRVKK